MIVHANISDVQRVRVTEPMQLDSSGWSQDLVVQTSDGALVLKLFAEDEKALLPENEARSQ